MTTAAPAPAPAPALLPASRAAAWTAPRASAAMAVTALERTVALRGGSAPVVAAAIALAHLHGALARVDVGMVLLDALLAERAPRSSLLDALAMLGPERGLALLRRALRQLREAAAVRAVAEAMVALAFRDDRDALAVERHLCLATIARHPTFWHGDVAWLAERSLPCTPYAMARAVAAAG